MLHTLALGPVECHRSVAPIQIIQRQVRGLIAPQAQIEQTAGDGMVAQADRIRQIEGVMGVVVSNEQFQIILGPGKAQTASEMMNLMLEEDAATGNTGHYDFSFPANIAAYKAGTVVLQPKDGKTYECKPFPYSGYCKQYSSTSTQFEPGVGSDWKEAWILKN